MRLLVRGGATPRTQHGCSRFCVLPLVSTLSGVAEGKRCGSNLRASRSLHSKRGPCVISINPRIRAERALRLRHGAAAGLLCQLHESRSALGGVDRLGARGGWLSHPSRRVDFLPGDNFVAKMDAAAAEAKATLALSSEAYFSSRYTQDEWTAALRRGTLLPVRIGGERPEGILGPLVSVDLLGLREEEARTRLVAAAGRFLTRERGKPEERPPFRARRQSGPSPPRPASPPPSLPTRILPASARPTSPGGGSMLRPRLKVRAHVVVSGADCPPFSPPWRR